MVREPARIIILLSLTLLAGCGLFPSKMERELQAEIKSRLAPVETVKLRLRTQYKDLRLVRDTIQGSGLGCKLSESFRIESIGHDSTVCACAYTIEMVFDAEFSIGIHCCAAPHKAVYCSDLATHEEIQMYVASDFVEELASYFDVSDFDELVEHTQE